MINNKVLETSPKIKQTLKNADYEESVCDTIRNLFDYMISRDYCKGSCHAISSVLFVALSELNCKPKLIIGECMNRNINFNHSWITLNDKVIDLAIYYPLVHNFLFKDGPIILDIDLSTNNKHSIIYGYKSGKPWDIASQNRINENFSDYMSNCPWETDGLWTVLQKILPDTISIDIEQLKEKYKDTKRIVVR